MKYGFSDGAARLETILENISVWLSCAKKIEIHSAILLFLMYFDLI